MNNISTDALADALAREEHQQGMPIGEPGHCEDCDRQARHERYAAIMAACQHEDWIDISTLGQLPGTSKICAMCGIGSTLT